MTDRRGFKDTLARYAVKAKKRLPWEQLFFNDDFTTPLAPAEAAGYQEVLEMVRLGPSASNKQPWRIVREDNKFHFYLERSPGYSERTKKMNLADVQRVDMGIATCHFELTAGEKNLQGEWKKEDPGIPAGSRLYLTSWHTL